MRKKIVDIEDGIILGVTDPDADRLPVPKNNGAVQGERDRRPLILADPAVIVGFEESHPALFVERNRLEVETRRVDMGGDDADPVFRRLGPDAEKIQAFSSVVEVIPAAGDKLVPPAVRAVPLPLRRLHGPVDRLALCFCTVNKIAIAFRVPESSLFFGVVRRFKKTLFLVPQLFFQFFCSRHIIPFPFFESLPASDKDGRRSRWFY